MVPPKILDEMNKLPIPDRLSMIELAIQSIREELGREPDRGADEALYERMATAARLLLPDYSHDDELTAFTALVGQDFYEER